MAYRAQFFDVFYQDFKNELKPVNEVLRRFNYSIRAEKDGFDRKTARIAFVDDLSNRQMYCSNELKNTNVSTDDIVAGACSYLSGGVFHLVNTSTNSEKDRPISFPVFSNPKELEMKWKLMGKI